MSDPLADHKLEAEQARRADEDASWFERLLQKLGLGEELDFRQLVAVAPAPRQQ